MEGAFQVIFNILSFTSIMVLVVLGLGVIASMMGIFNFAHGEFLLLGGYTAYLFHIWGLPVWLGIVAAPFVVGIVGVVLERTIIHRFYAAPIVAMLGTYAIGLIIRESVRGLIAGMYLRVPEPLVGMFAVGDISVSKWRVAVIIITILVVTGSYILLNRTNFGLRVRASLENPELARASGISTSQIYAATFAFGAALAGLAGAMMVPLFSLYADMGLRFLIQGFLAVMLGGIGTFEGPVLGGGLIGAMTAGLPHMVNPILADVLVFIIAIVLVKMKPLGLLAKGRK
jgi:branched-chain amino acid transport system permease protein